MLAAVKIRKDNYRITKKLSFYAESNLGVVLGLYKNDL